MIKAHTPLSRWRWGKCFVLENCLYCRAHTVCTRSPGPVVAAPAPFLTQVQSPNINITVLYYFLLFFSAQGFVFYLNGHIALVILRIYETWPLIPVSDYCFSTLRWELFAGWSRRAKHREAIGHNAEPCGAVDPNPGLSSYRSTAPGLPMMIS